MRQRDWKTIWAPAAAVLFVVVLAALPVAAEGSVAPVDLSDAKQQLDDNRLALEVANGSLAELDGKLERTKNQLTNEYRALDQEIRRRNREGEARHRDKIATMRVSKDELWVERERTKYLAQQLEARSEWAEAWVRIYELETETDAASAEVKQWQKKRDKADARAERMRLASETVEPPERM